MANPRTPAHPMAPPDDLDQINHPDSGTGIALHAAPTTNPLRPSTYQCGFFQGGSGPPPGRNGRGPRLNFPINPSPITHIDPPVRTGASWVLESCPPDPHYHAPTFASNQRNPYDLQSSPIARSSSPESFETARSSSPDSFETARSSASFNPVSPRSSSLTPLPTDDQEDELLTPLAERSGHQHHAVAGPDVAPRRPRVAATVEIEDEEASHAPASGAQETAVPQSVRDDPTPRHPPRRPQEEVRESAHEPRRRRLGPDTFRYPLYYRSDDSERGNPDGPEILDPPQYPRLASDHAAMAKFIAMYAMSVSLFLASLDVWVTELLRWMAIIGDFHTIPSVTSIVNDHEAAQRRGEVGEVPRHALVSEALAGYYRCYYSTEPIEPMITFVSASLAMALSFGWSHLSPTYADLRRYFANQHYTFVLHERDRVNRRLSLIREAERENSARNVLRTAAAYNERRQAPPNRQARSAEAPPPEYDPDVLQPVDSGDEGDEVDLPPGRQQMPVMVDYDRIYTARAQMLGNTHGPRHTVFPALSQAHLPTVSEEPPEQWTQEEEDDFYGDVPDPDHRCLTPVPSPPRSPLPHDPSDDPSCDPAQDTEQHQATPCPPQTAATPPASACRENLPRLEIPTRANPSPRPLPRPPVVPRASVSSDSSSELLGQRATHIMHLDDQRTPLRRRDEPTETAWPSRGSNEAILEATRESYERSVNDPQTTVMHTIERLSEASPPVPKTKKKGPRGGGFFKIFKGQR